MELCQQLNPNQQLINSEDSIINFDSRQMYKINEVSDAKKYQSRIYLLIQAEKTYKGLLLAAENSMLLYHNLMRKIYKCQ